MFDIFFDILNVRNYTNGTRLLKPSLHPFCHEDDKKLNVSLIYECMHWQFQGDIWNPKFWPKIMRNLKILFNLVHTLSINVKPFYYFYFVSGWKMTSCHTWIIGKLVLQLVLGLPRLKKEDVTEF